MYPPQPGTRVSSVRGAGRVGRTFRREREGVVHQELDVLRLQLLRGLLFERRHDPTRIHPQQ